MLKETSWIETNTGSRVDPLHLYDSEICIENIARPLSFLCRFAGQCSRFYSVAQHCIHVTDLVATELVQEDNRTCLAALLHDSAEAYINDISRPVKYAVKGLKEIEDIILGRIMNHFHLEGADWTLIKKMDNVMLATEALYFMSSKGEGWYLPEKPKSMVIPKLSMEYVYDLFMERFYKFGGK